MEYQIVCRICNQLINIEIIALHNDSCKTDAEFRRKLLQLNLQVARVCEKAYNMKHKIHLKGQKYLNSLKQVDNYITQQYSKEVYQQYKTLQLLISYGEKTLNSEMDTKYHLITQNELMAASMSLENRHVLDLVQQINKLINQRLDLCYKTKLLSFPSISFRLSKFSKDSPKSHGDSFNKINSFSDYLSSSNLSEDSQSDKKSFSRPETPGIKQVSIIKSLKQKGKISIFLKRQASQNWEDQQDSPEQKNKQSIKTKSYFAKTGSSDNEFEVDSEQIVQPKLIVNDDEQNFEQACFFALQRGYFSDTEMIRLDIENKILERNIGLKDFQFIKQIGQGAYGSVFQVKRIATGDHYAMKIINCSNKPFDRILNQLKQERNIFEILTGDYVVKAYFSFQHQSSLCFVQELMIGGDFSKILLNEGAFDENIAKHYFSEILLALEYLHNNNIIHRDLKPENILLDYNGHIKLADFGLSELGINKKMVKKLSQSPFVCSDLSPSPIYEMKKGRSFKKSNIVIENQERRIIGTPDYIAPEIIRGQSFSHKTQDFWSLGIILFEFLVGIPPFNDESVEKIYENILNELIEWPEIGDDPEEQISEQAYDLLKKLLNPDYTERLGFNSIEEIKKHPFLQSVDWNQLRNKPGPIKPIITQNSQQFDNIQEKVQKFLKRGERKHIQIVRKLQEELEYLERIDLLVATNEQQTQLIKQKFQLQ